MPTSSATRALASLSVICALVPPLSLVAAPIPKPGLSEFLLIFAFGGVVPAVWLALTIIIYRRMRTKRARWLFALAPVAFVYALGALVLGIGLFVKPGRW